MKNSFTTSALLLAAGFPGSLLAETAGLDLPTAFSPSTTFGVFVAVLTLLTAFADYGRTSVKPLTLAATTPDTTPATSAASPTPTHATEERRLAA